ncbi:MAG: tryptophan synthase subunit alpha [Methylobacteriaceae bacterium]|jgi:tryptophan synthase alpha chain|nr:tryptophan synthase subunit alpha [Methylobacteriaceae bacterium]
MTEQKPSLEQRITDARRANRVARVPYLTAGFPALDRFLPLLRDLDANGADIIEVGVPFSDPVADGPVVEGASRKALANGVSLEWIFGELKKLDPPLNAGLVLMGYYNPFLQFGFERLIKEAAAVGVQGFIVPDLPLEESHELRTMLKSVNIDLIALVGPNTDDARMQEYAPTASGYVYVVSVMGTTGVRAKVAEEANRTLERARRNFNVPVALGFGIQNPAQVDAMPVQPDAAVFGSALLKHIESGGSVAEFMKPWLE